MVLAWHKGIILKIQQESPTVKRFWIQLPELEQFHFIPGQFVTLDLPISERRNKRWRSYSIANAPNQSNIFELVIVKLEQGAGTTYLFEQASIGTEFLVRAAQGVFVLPEQLDKTLFLVCTGTGIAPYRSMLQYIQQEQLPHLDIHLIYGCRTEEDLLFKDEMEALALQNDQFFYHPITSRSAYKSHQGYVHSSYEALCSDLPVAHFMLCGWRPMVDEAKERIIKLGYNKTDVEFELYG